MGDFDPTANLSQPVEAGPPPDVQSTETEPSLGGLQRRIGRYVVLRALGQGGMGVVYAGYDEELDRKVAIKLLHPAQQGDTPLRARIFREAQSLARVSAPNVVHVYEVGEVGGQLFISMEFVNGTTLTRWQAEPGRSWKEILAMYCAAGQGLLDAHEAGLVHRDFKPDNVLLGKDGRPRVADFGLARLQNPNAGAATDAVSASYKAMSLKDDSNSALPPITQAGLVVGTPLYMSPEQHLGEPTDHRSDQFSFCVALYQALYHQLPFAGATVQQLAVNAIRGKILPRPASSHVPHLVHEALVRGLAKTAELRFPSMREMLAALSFDLSHDRRTAPQARRWVAFSMHAFVAVSIMGLIGLRLLGVSEQTGLMAGAVALVLFYALMLFRFRRTLRTNDFQRGAMTSGAVFAGQILFVHAVGIQLGLNLSQIMTFDLIAALAMTCIIAPLFLPRLWPQIPIVILAILAATIYPGYAELVASVIIPAALIATFRVWSHAVQLRVQTKREPAQDAG